MGREGGEQEGPAAGGWGGVGCVSAVGPVVAAVCIRGANGAGGEEGRSPSSAGEVLACRQTVHLNPKDLQAASGGRPAGRRAAQSTEVNTVQGT